MIIQDISIKIQTHVIAYNQWKHYNWLNIIM